MAFDVQLNLPPGWQKDLETYVDETGPEITHLEAHLYNARTLADEGLIDIYVGEMPDGETAEDQAMSNYVDIVGFDDDDPEDFNPVSRIKFNGKSAYSFDALCEDDSPMIFISQEVKKGILAVICCAAKDDRALEYVVQLVERNLRIK